MRNYLFLLGMLALTACQNQSQSSKNEIIITDDSVDTIISQKEEVQQSDSSDGSFDKLIDKITYSPTIINDNAFLPFRKPSYDTTWVNDSICNISIEAYYPKFIIKHLIFSDECKGPYLGSSIKRNKLSINNKILDLPKIIPQNDKGDYSVSYNLTSYHTDWKKFSIGNRNFITNHFYFDGCQGTGCLYSQTFLYEIGSQSSYTFSSYHYGGFFCDIDEDKNLEFSHFELIEGHPNVHELKSTFRLTLYEYNPKKQKFELMKDPKRNEYFVEISFDNGMFYPRNAKITKSHWFKPIP